MAAKPMRLIYGGSFDPVHLGHVALLQALHHLLPGSHITVVPNYQSPIKQPVIVNATDRLSMLRLATQDLAYVSISDYELQQAGIHYTIDSLRHFHALYPDDELALVVGTDLVANLSQWHKWRELRHYAKLLIIRRQAYDLPNVGDVASWLQEGLVSDLSQWQAATVGCVFFANVKLPAISSSQVRQAVVAQDDFRYLVPQPVAAYIKQHSLYC